MIKGAEKREEERGENSVMEGEMLEKQWMSSK